MSSTRFKREPKKGEEVKKVEPKKVEEVKKPQEVKKEEKKPQEVKKEDSKSVSTEKKSFVRRFLLNLGDKIKRKRWKFQI